MKKITVMFLSFILCAGMLSACVPGRVNPGTDYEVDIELDYEITGSLKIGIPFEAREEKMIKSAIEEYNVIFPNVDVTIQKIQSPYNNTLVTLYNADKKNPGAMPDIIMSNSTEMHANITNTIFLDIQPYINASTEAGKLDLDDFYPEMWVLGQKDFNGDQFLIPRSADRVVTHLNKKIFNDCFAGYADKDLPFTPRPGTKLPANGWTWNEFLDTCAALRAYYNANGKSHLYLIDAYLTWEAVLNPILLANGAEVFNENGGISLDSPETRSALTMMKNLIDLKYAAPLTSSTQANYQGGQGAMMFHSVSASAMREVLTDEYDLATFPLIGNKPKIGTGIPGYAIYGKTEKRDLAWTFLNFLISEDGQNALARGGLTTPPIRRDMSDPLTNQWGKGFEDVNMSAYIYKPEYSAATDFYIRFGSKYQTDLSESVTTLVTDALSKMSFADAISKCTESIDYILKG